MSKMVLALAAVALAAAPAAAQSGAWADKIFLVGGGQTSHDFGTVARGAQLVHSFTFTNIYSVPLEITNVRTSCGCVNATPSTRVLKPREKAQLNLTMDARRFSGPKTVSIYVTVGPEYISTATLRVSANARSDVVLNPGGINFGVVRQGQSLTQVLDVEYAGAFPWQVTDVVKNAAAPYDVRVTQLYREPARGRHPGKAGYRVAVTLKPDAPAGPLNHELILKTNEPGNGQFLTVVVEGNVQASLVVTPNVANFGRVKVGAEVIQKVQIRGQRPFRILAVEGVDAVVRADLPAAPAQNHLLTLRCRPVQAGELRRRLLIRTDLDPTGPTVAVDVEARAVP